MRIEVLLLALLIVVYGCLTAKDCSLNGECISSKCVCDPGWSSDACNVLAFEDASTDTGYHNKTFASWGGLPIKGDDGMYHLFAAEMVNGCLLNSWTLNSQIIHAVSKSIEGPYEKIQIVLTPFAHNPTITRAPDGTYLLYFIGSWPTVPQKCNNKSQGVPRATVKYSMVSKWENTSDGCGPAPMNNGCGIHLATSKSLNGPWDVRAVVIEFPIPKEERWDCAHTNPTVIVAQNGSLLLAFNAGYCRNHLETIGIAKADHWSGPYSLWNPKPIFQANGVEVEHIEDPHMWKDNRGYHMLVHAERNAPYVGGYGYSEDGYNWVYSPAAYSLEVTFEGGQLKKYKRRERPQIYVEQGKPPYLFNGVELPDAGPASYTAVQQFK